MQLHELKEQLINKTTLPLYMFTGDEIAIMDIYINMIVSTAKLESRRADSVSSIFGSLSNQSILNKSFCYIIRDDEEYTKQEKIWDRLNSGTSQGKNIIILLYTKIDKRGKFYKAHQDYITEFTRLSPQLLSNYINKELPGMSEKERIHFAEVCECDYSRILLECDKIKQYSLAAQVQYGLALAQLLQTGVIHQPIGDITFKFTDAVLLRNYKDTEKYLLQIKQKQESEVMLLAVLYNGFKQILQVQGLGSNTNDAANKTGLTAWQVKMANEKKGHYTLSELVNAIDIIRKAEKGIKTGQIDADVSLDYVLSNVL